MLNFTLNFTNSPAVNLSLLLLLVFSIVTWSLILAKFWQQTQARRQNEKLKRLFWSARDFSEAEKSAAGEDGMLARLCQMGFATLRKAEYAADNLSLAGNATLNVVAGPVGDALIATAVGIATAVPAVLAYNYGVRRLRLYVAELDQFATDFLNLAAKSEFRVEPK